MEEDDAQFFKDNAAFSSFLSRLDEKSLLKKYVWPAMRVTTVDRIRENAPTGKQRCPKLTWPATRRTTSQRRSLNAKCSRKRTRTLRRSCRFACLMGA